MDQQLTWCCCSYSAGCKKRNTTCTFPAAPGARLRRGNGLPAAAGLVGAVGVGDGRGILDGSEGAGLLHALVVLDLLLPALLAAERHLTPARKQNRVQRQSGDGRKI
jgi:hypothetical protein